MAFVSFEGTSLPNLSVYNPKAAIEADSVEASVTKRMGQRATGDSAGRMCHYLPFGASTLKALSPMPYRNTCCLISCLFLFFTNSCLAQSNAQLASSSQETSIDRAISAKDVDPAIYWDFNDPTDPFRDIYAGFRARRASDMSDSDKPKPIPPYKPVHLIRDMSWTPLEEVFPFDWATIRAESRDEAEQLEGAVKARLAFDHPDVKITQLILGPGATLPGHAGGSPGFYYVIGGRGEVTVEGQTQTVTPGATVKLHPYDVRRVYASTDESLKLIWVRWAPNGDQRYIAAGYYLTGANQHIQPIEATLPPDYQFWGEGLATVAIPEPSSPVAPASPESIYEEQAARLTAARAALGEQRMLYPETPVFSHESESRWIDEKMLKGSGFFWAKDISSLGALTKRWSEVMRLKGFFRAKRPDGGWDFNISQMVWGPHARYVEHSHSIPEFYYMLSGPVEHWVGEDKYVAMPGDIFMTNSYQTHQSRGIVDDLPFRNIGASWAPNGDRTVFKRPFYLVEPLGLQPVSANLGEAPVFH